MHPDIIERENILRRLFDHASELRKNEFVDLEVRSAFESYLCIRTYAYVETSVRTILLQRISSVTQDDSIVNYVASQLRRQRNLWYSELIKLLNSFNPDWSNLLKSGVTERMKTSLDSLVGIRNRIAHSDDVDISLKDMENYFSYCKEIIRLVFDACAPATDTAVDS